jgi:SAM-dependent methyltransferase
MSSKRQSVIARSESSREAVRTWERAYDASPQLAAEFVWTQVIELLRTYPGECVYEAGFGSGLNLRWAREHGWEVAGCDVAPQALARARAFLPGADLRHESIVDCSAPSAYFDVVVDRAALCYLSPKDLEKAVAQVRRILKLGGVFLFNPYGTDHSMPAPADTPEPARMELGAVHRLLPDAKWDWLSFKEPKYVPRDGSGYPVEHTMQVVVRKR